jgi:hypothetical protein
MDERLQRQARNEALMREVNERIEAVDKAADDASFGPEARFEFLCECGGEKRGEPACDQRVEMTIDEYETVRSQDDRFVVYPGHANEALEHIVTANERFAVVDKRPEAEPLVDDDPRGASSR